MNYKRIFFLLFAFVFSVPLALFPQQPRQTLLFNSGWKFHKGDVSGGENIELNDENWRPVDLPHDWSIESPFDQKWASATAYLPGGIGWYRKTFTVSPQLASKKLFIYFDGVYKNSEVWINGHYLGKRPNGFIPFQYELTRYINKTGSNVLAVKVDHSQFADSRWYTGSGIYRNVYLKAVEPIHISLWGVGFTTPQISQSLAAANVAVSVTNSTTSAAKVLVKSELADAQGKVVANAQKVLQVPAAKEANTALAFNILKPQLWSVDRPYLYQLKLSLYVNGKKTDEWTDRVGVRSIKFDPDHGFFLNGKNLKLKGVCIHDDAGALGVAVPEAVWVRRLRSLKEAGCNSLRMSHNPHADYLYRLCDSLGFLVMDEAFDEWEVGKNKWIEGWNVGTPGKDGYHEYFKEWADRDLRDMILRNRNRPSIIMWSIGNEIDYPNDPYSHEILNTGRNPQIYGKGYLPDHPPASRLGELSAHLVKVAKQYDTSRPVTAALAGVVMSNTTTYPGNLDIVGYNYQEYRYQEDHEKYPSRVIYGSENGMSLNAWNAVDSNEYISAQYLWTGIDYLGEAGKWPVRSNGAGLLDLAGFPKPEYYFRKSLWAEKPTIYIGTTKISGDDQKSIWSHKKADPVWNWNPGDQVRVNCFTNCQEAELFLNGKSLGKKTLAEAPGRIIYWDTNYEPGELIVKGFNKGRLISADTLKTAGKPFAIKATFDKSLSKGPGALYQVEIQVVDEKGNPVYDNESEITVQVEGAAKLIGLESGSHTSHESYQSNQRKALHGRLLAYIQLKSSAQAVKVKLSSPGLKGESLSGPYS